MAPRNWTDAYLKSLQANDKRQEHSDGMVPGLKLVIHPLPSDLRVFYVRYSVGGVSKRFKLGRADVLTLKAARDAARQALALVAAGDDPALIKKRKIAAAKAEKEAVKQAEELAFEKVLRRYITEHAAAIQPNGQPRLKSHLNLCRLLENEFVTDPKTKAPIFKGKAITEIDKAAIKKVIGGIVARGSPVSASRALQSLKAFLNWCVVEDILAVSPAASIKKPVDEVSRERVLSDDELRRLWLALDAETWPVRQCLQLIVLTGMRRSEAGALRWQEVSFEDKAIRLPALRVKNGNAHELPLTEDMIALLSSCPRKEGAEHVFGKREATFWNRHATRLRHQLNFADEWTIHDLRRTLATNLQKLGVRLEVTEALLNHTSGSRSGIVGVYQRYSWDAEKRQALEAWEKRLREIVSGEKPASNVIAFGK